MSDVYSRAKRSEVMGKVRGVDTKPELAVRRLLHAMGYRFRLHRKDLPGTPDIVLPARHAAIFVHGCFWHSHQGCKAAARPASNQEYWGPKLDRNVTRDRRNQLALRRLGWRVIVVWECRIKGGASRRLSALLRRFLG